MSRRFAALAVSVALAIASGAQAEDGSGRAKGWSPPTGAADVADPERGATLWGKCQACHTYQAGKRHSVGPNLHGMFGRKAGAAEGFKRYSEAMAGSTVVWTEETLDGYLAATTEYMPGTKMYAGLSIPRDRLDLIAWLRDATRADPGSEPTP